MYTPVYTKQFDRDIKRARKRGKNLVKFKIIACALLAGKPLDPIHRDHRLVGNYVGRRECHIESNWLLIYKVEPLRIVFERMGAHSDLFNLNYSSTSSRKCVGCDRWRSWRRSADEGVSVTRRGRRSSQLVEMA